MAQAKIKQILGLQSTLNALSGVTKIKETISTNAGSGPTGFGLAYDARELNGIIVHVNGVKVESFTWINGIGDTISTTLIPQGSQLVWDSTNAGYDLSDTDIIEIVYETLTGGAIAFNGFGEYSNPGSGATGPQGAIGTQGPQGPAGTGTGNISGTVDGHLIPDTNEAYDLGSADKKFRDLYLSGNTLYMGGQPLSIVNGTLTLNGSAVTGSVETIESHSLKVNTNTSGIWTDPITESESFTEREYRIKTDYLTLDIGDEIFQPWYLPGTTVDYNKSFNKMMQTFIGADSFHLLHKNTGEVLKYKMGSLSGFWSHMYRIELQPDASWYEDWDGSRIMLIGFENLDPTWPSTDMTILPTISVTYQQPVNNYPDPDTYVDYGVIDQHIRAKIIDTCDINGIRHSVNSHAIKSGNTGQSDIDLSNFVGISVIMYTPSSGSRGTGTLQPHVMQGEVTFQISRS